MKPIEQIEVVAETIVSEELEHEIGEGDCAVTSTLDNPIKKRKMNRKA